MIVAAAAAAAALGGAGAVAAAIGAAGEPAPAPAAALPGPPEEWFTDVLRADDGRVVGEAGRILVVDDGRRLAVALALRNTSDTPISVRGLAHLTLEGERIGKAPLIDTWMVRLAAGESTLVSESQDPLPPAATGLPVRAEPELAAYRGTPRHASGMTVTGVAAAPDGAAATATVANPGPRLRVVPQVTVVCGADPAEGTAATILRGRGADAGIAADRSGDVALEVIGSAPPRDLAGCVGAAADHRAGWGPEDRMPGRR